MLEEFAGFMAGILAHSAVPGGALRWTVVANPRAGGFTIPSRWRRHRQVLAKSAERAKAWNRPREDSMPSRLALETGGTPGAAGLIATERPGHAGQIAEALLREAGSSASQERHLVVCAGGDGTSLEVLTAIHAAPEELRDRFIILRLPMGTGNDGADSRDLDTALELLVRQTRTEKSAALMLHTSTPGKGPFMAFNILSAGLDAFVTHMTNRMKGKLPGDSYTLWVDVAALLYDRIYRVGKMTVTLFDRAGNETETLRETPLLLAAGVTGHRSYGGGKLILPDGRNVCMVRQMPLFRKVALKNLFTTGRHVDLDEVLLFSAEAVRFSGEHPILAQMDGETVLLEKNDFPATISITPPSIFVLKRIQGTEKSAAAGNISGSCSKLQLSNNSNNV